MSQPSAFRAPEFVLPESGDLLDEGITREFSKQWDDDGKARLEFGRTEEAKRALEIEERLKTLGQSVVGTSCPRFASPISRISKEL